MQASEIDKALPPAGFVTDSESGTAAPRGHRLPLRRKVAYSAGQLVELVVSSMLNIFALFYVTAVCGLPGGLAGLALGVGLFIDAVLDPVIGSLSDGWRSRFGRRVPFMVVGIAPLVLTFNLIFALPSTLSDTGLFIWLTLLSVSLRISLSIFALPYQALGAELSDDYSERSSIAAWRWGVGVMGTVAVIALGYGVFLSGPGGLSNRAGYQPLTMTLTVLIVAGALIAIHAGLVTRALQQERATPRHALHRRLLGELAEMFRNRTFRVLFSSKLLLHVAQGFNQALALHLGVFFWLLDSGQMQALMTAAVLGLALSAFLAGPLAARIEKRTMLIAGFVGLGACYTTPVVLKLLGLLPLTGGALTGLLSAFGFAVGAMFTVSAIAFISIIPDATDEHEHLFGTRREGLYFAGWAFASKAAHGAGLLIAGLVLQLIQFPSSVSEPVAAAIPEQTLTWLAIAGGPGSGLMALIGAVIVLFYRLDRKAHARIMADLVARRRA
jgi:glycoside/pentoside/hexuronide:cation symporter, GPH family